MVTVCLAFGYVPETWQKVRVIYSYQSQGVAHMNWQNHSDHQFDIFSLENDGKAGGFSYKGGTIKGLSFESHAARIPKKQID
jgi:hypothetical protein